MRASPTATLAGLPPGCAVTDIVNVQVAVGLLCRDHLTSGGALAINAAKVPSDDRLAAAVRGTVATVFPSTWTWKALRFNEMILGLDQPAMGHAELVAREDALAPELAVLRPSLDANLSSVSASDDPMTDDRAPVEWLTDRMFIEHIAKGGILNEHLLPTAPGP